MYLILAKIREKMYTQKLVHMVDISWILIGWRHQKLRITFPKKLAKWHKERLKQWKYLNFMEMKAFFVQ